MPGQFDAFLLAGCDRQFSRRRQFASPSVTQTDRQTVSTLAFSLALFYSSGTVCVLRTESSCLATVICVGAPFGLPDDLDLTGIRVPYLFRSHRDRTIVILFL